VDVILEQLSVFWANTDVVLDVLTKKGQHIEQFINFAHKPRLMARFRERMEEYKRFWEGMHIMCNNYIQGVNLPPTSASAGVGAGTAMDTGASPASAAFGPNMTSADFSTFNATGVYGSAGTGSRSQKGGPGGLYDFLDRNNSSGSDGGGLNINSISGTTGMQTNSGGGASSRSNSGANSDAAAAGWTFSHGSVPAATKGTPGHTHAHAQTTTMRSPRIDKIDSV
jgi:hypothetical protein